MPFSMLPWPYGDTLQRPKFTRRWSNARSTPRSSRSPSHSRDALASSTSPGNDGYSSDEQDENDGGEFSQQNNIYSRIVHAFCICVFIGCSILREWVNGGLIGRFKSIIQIAFAR